MGGRIISSPATDPQFNQASQVTIFDDMIGGNYANSQSTAYTDSTVNGGGVVRGGVNTVVAAQPGRPGIIELDTFTTGNSTGQATLESATVQFYLGTCGLTMQWSFMVPQFGTAANPFVLEMGLGASYYAGKTAANNGALIIYNFASSTFFIASTSQSASTYLINPGTNGMTANVWYNAKIYCHPDASAVDFYIAPAGSPLALIGTSATFLPNAATYACNPVFNCYKGLSTTTSSKVLLDWMRLDFTGLNR